MSSYKKHCQLWSFLVPGNALNHPGLAAFLQQGWKNLWIVWLSGVAKSGLKNYCFIFHFALGKLSSSSFVCCRLAGIN